MGIIFDGKSISEKIFDELKTGVVNFESKRGRKPKLVTVYDPNDEGSRIYTNIKAKKAEELGVIFDKFPMNEAADLPRAVAKIKEWNVDPGVDGIMVQLPISGSTELIQEVDPVKDVDGLRKDSPFLPATARAVKEILRIAMEQLGEENKDVGNLKILVVGNKGQVGKRIQKSLKCTGMDEEDFDPDLLKLADVVVSATGSAGLIKPEMIKKGVIGIDVGYPKGDFEPEMSTVSSFFTPVPGGVGPVTVAMLFRNLLKD